MADPKPIDLGALGSWLNAEQAAALLGCSRMTIYNLGVRGELHPQRSRDGLVRYDPKEVEELAARYIPRFGRPNKGTVARVQRGGSNPGSRQSRIVDAIMAGHKPAEIVKALRVTFAEVHEVFAWMQRDLGSVKAAFERAEEKDATRFQEKVMAQTTRVIEASQREATAKLSSKE